MKVEFINHASVIIDTGHTRILTDPWYNDSIFINGWNLLYEKNQDINIFDFEYIWISHEHPDHFSIKDLLSIKDIKKKKIKILFQKTEDRKVYNFLINKGFNVIELDLAKEFKLNKFDKLFVDNIGGFDSWFLIKNDNHCLLNLNDCQTGDQDLQKICNLSNQNVDILLTQFSHANWICNKNDDLLGKQQVNLITEKVLTQIRIINPRVFIPFASFVYFSHEENKYLNKYSCDIKKIYNLTKNLLDVAIMFPGDELNLSKRYTNNELSLEKWMDLYDNIDNRKFNKTKSVSMDEIKLTYQSYINKIKKENNFFAIKFLCFINFFKPIKIHIIDLDKKVKFFFDNELKLYDDDKHDLIISSECFYYLLKFNWGRGSLFISGRLFINYQKFFDFMKLTKIFYANNIGKFFPKTLTLKDLSSKSSFSQLIDEAVE